MSSPSTPISKKKQFFPDSEACTNENSASASWLDVIGGVMGELFQSWGFLSALKRRGWNTVGGKSSSNMSSPFSHSSSSIPEQIELSQFNVKNPCYLRVEGMRPGRGHDFKPTTLERPAWCDACAHLVFYHATTCHNCSFTCHEQCQKVVSLDCKVASSDAELLLEDELIELLTEEDVPSQQEVDDNNGISDKEQGGEDNKKDNNEGGEEEILEKEMVENHILSNFKKSEVSTLKRTTHRIQSNAVDSVTIEEWVQKCPSNNVGLQITKESDGGYRGCLRVHLNLCRPINIVAGTRPPSIYDILQEDRTMEKTLTSFYMPRDAVKAIHITNKTTTREVIAALLKKFKVVDNPQKFALYERSFDAGHSMKAKLRRLSDHDCPLVLAIAWNAQGVMNKRLVLQENDTADIQWEAFTLPELGNFLRILDREELEYKNQIRDKYKLLKLRMETQLANITNQIQI